MKPRARRAASALAAVALTAGLLTIPNIETPPPATAWPCPDGTQTCGPAPTIDPGPTGGNNGGQPTAPSAPTTTVPGITPNTGLPQPPTQGPANDGSNIHVQTPDFGTTAPPPDCIVNCPTVTPSPPTAGAQTPAPTPGAQTAVPRPNSAATTSPPYEYLVHNTFTQEDTAPRFDACFTGARGPNFLITVFAFTFVNLDKKKVTDQQLDLACGSESGGLIHIRNGHDTWGNSPQDVVNCIGNILDFSGGEVRKAKSAGHVVASWQGNEVVFNSTTGVIKTAYPATTWAACAAAVAGPWHPEPGMVY